MTYVSKKDSVSEWLKIHVQVRNDLVMCRNMQIRCVSINWFVLKTADIYWLRCFALHCIALPLPYSLLGCNKESKSHEQETKPAVHKAPAAPKEAEEETKPVNSIIYKTEMERNQLISHGS